MKNRGQMEPREQRKRTHARKDRAHGSTIVLQGPKVCTGYSTTVLPTVRGATVSLCMVGRACQQGRASGGVMRFI